MLSVLFYAVFFVNALWSVNANDAGHFQLYQSSSTCQRTVCENKTVEIPERMLSCRCWNDTKTDSYQQCATVDTPCNVSSWQCQPGYMEPDCTQPICSSGCGAGQICLRPDTCGCPSGTIGTYCDAVTSCPSNNLDCYPGTCVSNSCTCPPGFSGNNCETLLVKPTLTNCHVLLYVPDGSLDRSIADQTCSSETVDPNPIWISYSVLRKIQFIWTAGINLASPLPRASYIQLSSVPIGITRADIAIDFLDHGGVEFTDTSTSTSWKTNQPSFSSPVTTATFENTVQWNDVQADSLMTHNRIINMTVSAQAGGQKTFRGTTQSIQGPSITGRVQFRLDLRRPTHCLLTNNPANCPCFPVHLDQDIRTDPVIRPQACNWTDDGSGIWYVRYELFYMQPDANNLLGEVGSQPLKLYDDYQFLQNTFRYTVQTPGVYSIRMTVFDRASNYVIARKLFLYAGDTKMTVNRDIQPYIAEAAQSTNWQWINQLPQPTDSDYYQLTVKWNGRYRSDARFDAAWLKAAGPAAWCTPGNGMCIDDQYDTRYGFRSVNAIQDMTGITGYMLSFAVDSHGGNGLLNPPPFNLTPSTQEQRTIFIHKSKLSDGDTIVVWLNVTDIAGNQDYVKFKVGLDRTVPNVMGDSFSTGTVDQFTSSFNVTVRDDESGIEQIDYFIYDQTRKVIVWSDTVSGSFLGMDLQSNNRSKREASHLCPPEGDKTCYCIPAGTCYPLNQTINIDNCKFDRYINDPLLINYTVRNQAGLSRSGVIQLRMLTEVECRPTPFTGLSIGAIIGIVVGLCILAILLLILIGLMLWRWKTKRDPLPQRVRQAFTMFRHQSGNKDANNPVYGSSAEFCHQPDDIEKKNPVIKIELSKAASLRIPGKPSIGKDQSRVYSANNVHIDGMLAEGRFAVVSRGSLKHQLDYTPVAVKALKRDFTDEDRNTMLKKIDFLSKLPPHRNIVQLVGYYTDDEKQGPVMLLELCEVPLKDWLSKIDDFTSEDLENMFSFILDIARGVERLHKEKIIHRRIRCGNVLLRKDENGRFVAQLIGFTPSSDDESSVDENILPIRWLAPETHRAAKKGRPIYDFRTDAWSYGITVWEIYSKGQKPYPQYDIENVVEIIQDGVLMDCPAKCPSQMFQDVVLQCWRKDPKNRPTFSAICKSLTKLQRGAVHHEDYYSHARLQQLQGRDYVGGVAYDATGIYSDIRMT